MTMTERSKEICIKAHEGQMDKSGKPYYLHPFAVAEMLDTETEKQIGYLHDVIEDTDMTIEDLKAEGFDNEVLSAVEAITKRPGEPYDEYIQRVKQNKTAMPEGLYVYRDEVTIDKGHVYWVNQNNTSGYVVDNYTMVDYDYMSDTPFENPNSFGYALTEDSIYILTFMDRKVTKIYITEESR